MAAEEVNGHAWEGDPDPDQGVDGVAVQRYHHQEDREEAEDDGEEETELWTEAGENIKETVRFITSALIIFNAVAPAEVPLAVALCPAASSAGKAAQE